MATPTSVPTAPLATYVELDRLVDQAEANGLRARWEFGRALLSERRGKRLPNRRLEEIAIALGRSRQEIGYRMQFAERFPTEEELSNALESFRSWHGIVSEALANPGRGEENGGSMAESRPPSETHTEIVPGFCPECGAAVTIQVVCYPSADAHDVSFIPGDKLGHDWFPGDDE